METEPEASDRMRLANMLVAARTKMSLGVAEVAKVAGVTEQWMRDVEAGWGVLASAELRDACSALELSYEEALEAARSWNKSIWEKPTQRMTLEPMSAETRALKEPVAADLQREVIRLADDLAFVANVARELSIRAEKAALRAREALAMSGAPVPVDDDPVEVRCDFCEKPILLGRDLAVFYEDQSTGTPGGCTRRRFCNTICGSRWMQKQSGPGESP